MYGKSDYIKHKGLKSLLIIKPVTFVLTIGDILKISNGWYSQDQQW